MTVRPAPSNHPVSARLPPARSGGPEGRFARADLVAVAGALGLVALAALVGGVLYVAGRPVHATSAPFTGAWRPHVGPGTPIALALALVVVGFGPRLAATLSWRRLLAAGYATSVAWILALALIDGWHRGVTGRLTTRPEYLSQVGGVTDVPAMLRGFAGRILDFQPDSWTTHVAGHPPGAFLVFIALDRLGLGGGTWAALLCVATGALCAIAVPVTLRALHPAGDPDDVGRGGEVAARAAMPFVVLFPGAVWIGVSADGMFAGVTATGLALLAIALTRRNAVAGLGAGLLLAGAIYLSYGLTLIAVPALAVVLLAARRPVLPIIAALAGAVAVVAAFTLAGFWWPSGYHLVTLRYYQGIASVRPYAYWVWADLALVVASAGPVAAVILHRAGAASAAALPHRAGAASAAVTPRPTATASAAALPHRLIAIPRRLGPTVVLPGAALLAILAADVSGYSKAEVERIWLPFAVWLMAGAGLLPHRDRRWWLAGQAVIALLINHLLLTTW